MKKSVTSFLGLILLASCLVSCNFFKHDYTDKKHDYIDVNTDDICDVCGHTQKVQETTKENTEHTHQWQDVSGEHASICIECNEKQLKPEACNFVRENCESPMECTICHAISGEPTEKHDWEFVSQTSDCWSTTVIHACSKCGMEEFLHGDSALPHHSWKEETVNGKTTFSCTRCNESITFVSEIRTFSYAEVLAEYKIGDPGVKHENFNNPEIEREGMSAIDAIIRAKFEVTIEYNTVSVFYDEESNMWHVSFYTFDIPGGDQSVYVNDNGLTCYIVYGE